MMMINDDDDDCDDVDDVSDNSMFRTDTAEFKAILPCNAFPTLRQNAVSF